MTTGVYLSLSLSGDLKMPHIRILALIIRRSLCISVRLCVCLSVCLDKRLLFVPLSGRLIFAGHRPTTVDPEGGGEPPPV